MRVIVLEFLDTDVFNVSHENCSAFLVPRVECWDVDLDSLGLVIRLNRRFVADPQCTFRSVESEPDAGSGEEPGLAVRKPNSSLSWRCTATFSMVSTGYGNLKCSPGGVLRSKRPIRRTSPTSSGSMVYNMLQRSGTARRTRITAPTERNEMGRWEVE